MTKSKELQIRFSKQVAALLDDLLTHCKFGDALVKVSAKDDEALFNDSCAAIHFRYNIGQMRDFFAHLAEYSEIIAKLGFYDDVEE